MLYITGNFKLCRQRMIKKYAVCCALCACLSFSAVSATAEEKDRDWWKNSKQTAGELWDKTAGGVDILVEKSSGLLDSEEKDEELARVWEDIAPSLNSLVDLHDEQGRLPESAWFGRDRGDSEDDINKLLSEAVGILSISESTVSRDQIRVLQEQIKQHKNNIATYRQAKISAPLKSPWKTTVAGYDKKIQQEQEEIRNKQVEIETLKAQFAQDLHRIGLDLNREQLDLLLSSVVGDDIVQSGVVYAHVKQISGQLMELTRSSGEDIHISKRYYGMYTVLLKILLHMQSEFIHNIDERYLPKIDKIESEVSELNGKSRDLLRQRRDDVSRKHLEANMAAQDLTLRTADLYRRHLHDQRAKMALARNRTAADLEVAGNTYRTVTLSGELVKLIRAGQESFNLLVNIQVPDLLMFENLQMQQEFAVLTAKLAE